ncbi:MAG: alkaline shock response membrane anchor protein AmaP [Candidatus Lindowbacteria bacterium]|nr:alkaline shock response membrane anchor protein AmaP [Candidatus Lindowbacteria bacterium]
MGLIKSVILILIAGVLFLLSICLMLVGLMAFNQQFTAIVIHTITKANVPILYFGGGLLVFVASWILYGIAGQSPDSSAALAFQGDKGPINISLRAIEDFISKRFSEKGSIVNSIRPRVTTSRDRKRLRIRASVSVWSDRELKNVAESVQHNITHCLKEGLGLDNVETVLVSVDKIVPTKSS